MGDHQTTIEPGDVGDAGRSYHAACACGWVGAVRPARFMAADDASLHHRLVVTVERSANRV